MLMFESRLLIVYATNVYVHWSAGRVSMRQGGISLHHGIEALFLTRLSDDQTDLRSIPDTCLNNFEVLGCKEWGRLR